MIRWGLNLARGFDDYLRTRLGRPYHVVLGVGLVVEIVRALKEAPHWGEHAGGAVGAALAVMLFALLLLHQLAELSEHFERRRPPRP